MIELTVDWQKIINLDDIPNVDADGDDTGAIRSASIRIRKPVWLL